jgi:hypothetical protein
MLIGRGNKPKFSEKTCPGGTFVNHKIPHDQTRVWTRAAALGTRRLTAWAMARPLAQSLRHYAASRKVAVSRPDEVVFLNLSNPFGRTMGSTQPLTEMSTRNL